VLICYSSGENTFHRRHGNNIPRSQLTIPYNKLFAQDPDAFITTLAQHKDSLRQFTYITGGSRQSKPAVLGNFNEFTQLREVALSAHTLDLQAALLSHDGPPVLVSLSLDIMSMEMFHELEQLHDVIRSSEQVLGPEDVSTRMASKVSSILFPRFSSAMLRRLQHLRVILTDNAYIRDTVTAELRQQWIRLIGAHWLKYDIAFFLYSRERTSIIPPTLFGEEQGAPRDTLEYSSDSGFSQKTGIVNGYESWW
jgi:hypothetical protein